MKWTKWVYVSVLVSIFIVYACGKLGYTDPIRLFKNTPQISLDWEHSGLDINGEPEYLSHFNLYYRPHGTTTWVLVDSTPGYSIVIDIDAMPGEGEYDFAVSAVDMSDNESELHTSLDPTAVPAGGWYLLWLLFGDTPPSIPLSLRLL